MQQHASTFSVLTHILSPWDGVKGLKYFSSKISHAAYQGNGAQSTMQAHILSLHTLLTYRWG